MQSAEYIFEQAGLKPTASRIAVVEVLMQSALPQTHQEILKQLSSTFDRVTLYRVLDWLLQNKIIHRVAGEDRTWRFQLNSTSNTQYRKTETLPDTHQLTQSPHAHFKCAECGKVFCLNNVQPNLTGTMPTGFVVDSIELNIRGKCNDCQP